MKSYMPQIAANRKLCERISKDIIKNRLSHAYIIEGAPGTGRRTFAKSIAQAIACSNKDNDSFPLPCNICDNCKKISNGLSPDVITVSREEDKATIGVDAARFIKSDINILPNELDYKIYIIEDADRMTVEAQNALLLTLEEPPSYVIFILATTEQHKLPATIISRCQRFEFRRISISELAARLEFIASEEEIELEKKRAINEVKDEVSDLAIGIAGAVIERDIKKSDHDALIEDFINKLGEE